MGIYFLLFAEIAGLSLIYRNVKIEKKQFDKVFSVIFFISLLLIIGLRHPSMGHDLRYGSFNGYLGSFDIIGNMSWQSVWKIEVFLNYEKGFIVFCKIVSSIWHNTQFFLFVSAFLTLFPVFLFIYKKSEDVRLSSIIYMGVPAFLITYSGVRQGIAIGICFLALLFLQAKRKKTSAILFILLVLLASTFHTSAILFLLALPLYYLKGTKEARWISVCFLPIIYVFRYQLFYVLSKIFKEEATTTDTGSFTLLLVFVGIYIVCIIFSNTDDREYNWYMNMFYVACVCQIFSGIYDTAMRLGYYFMIFLALLLPKLIAHMKNKNDKILFNLGVAVAFGAFALYSIYKTPWAMAYPHHFFWEVFL